MICLHDIFLICNFVCTKSLSISGFKVASWLLWSKQSNNITVGYNYNCHPENWIGVFPLWYLCSRCRFSRHCCCCLLEALQNVKFCCVQMKNTLEILKLIHWGFYQHLKIFVGQSLKENWRLSLIVPSERGVTVVFSIN